MDCLCMTLECASTLRNRLEELLEVEFEAVSIVILLM